MKSINPYLSFNGNAEEAFNFYKSVFGGEFTSLRRFKDIKNEERKAKLKKEEMEWIVNVVLPVGNNMVLAGSDAPEFTGAVKFGDSVYISITTESKEETEKLFKGLSEGGKIEMELKDTDWGSYHAVFQDKFGFGWVLSYNYQK